MQARKIIFNPLVILLIIILVSIGVFIHHDAVNPLAVPLQSQLGTSTNLEKYVSNNKTRTLVVFWASWCEHCKSEVEILNQFKALHPEINIIGIQVDDGANSAFPQANYPSLKASNKNAALLMSRFGNSIGSIPFIVVLNSTGNLLDSIEGKTSLKELELTMKHIKE
jgi:thiol-disulfide isomerase/thioredoxin